MMMNYCKHCGQLLIEGEDHTCIVPESMTAPTQASNFQTSKIKPFLLNPFYALRNKENDWYQYGLLGIAAHILAYFI